MTGRGLLDRSGLAGLSGAVALMLLVALVAPSSSQAQVEGGGPAASLLAAAERRARDGDLPGAIEDYEQLVRQFPESAQAPEALLAIARGQLSLENSAGALATVERLVTTYPRMPQAASGLLLEGRVHSERPTSRDDLEGARKTLEKVWLLFPRERYPRLPARSAARVLDGWIALRLQGDLEATTSFLEVIEREPQSRWTADAHAGLAAALVRSGEWRAASESLQEALGIDGASAETLALARRRLSLIHRRLLRPEQGEKLWVSARRLTLAGAQSKRISAIAADDVGRLAVVDSGTDQLLAVGANGTLENRWPLRAGERPSWSRGASLQVAARDAVIVPGQTSLQFQVPGKDKVLDGIRAVERDPYGRWVILASRSNGVLSYRPDRGSGRPVLRGDGDPVDLAVDDRDRLYVLERKNGRVLRIDQHQEARHTAASGAWKQASALTVDALGFVHVLDAGQGRIHTYDPAGQEVAVVGPLLPGGLELRKGEDLAVTGDGRLLIVDARGGVFVMD